MDLQLFIRVVRRFWILVALGILFAAALAALSVVKVGRDGISYRQSESFVAYQTTLVTQAGFPWGSLDGEQRSAVGVDGARLGTTHATDISRLTALAVIYSKLATGDEIRALVRASGVSPGTVEAAPLPAVAGAPEAVPVLSIAAYGPTESLAIRRARATADALQTYVTRQQARNRIPDAQRVVLSTVSRADGAKLVAGRSLSLPIVIFFAISFATIAIAFVLENLRASAAVANPVVGAGVARDAA